MLNNSIYHCVQYILVCNIILLKISKPKTVCILTFFPKYYLYISITAVGCEHVTMRLRKYCGDSQTDPELCTMPILNAYSIEDGIPASLVREQNLRTSITSHDAFGALRTLEWFEENPYTRKNEVPGWNCGCEQGEELWTALIKQTYTWWVEISNPFLSSSTDVCQFSFRAHAVDICSGHGEWIQNQGCRCDAGYSGQYSGPIAKSPIDSDINQIEKENLFIEIENKEKKKKTKKETTKKETTIKETTKKKTKVNAQGMLRGASTLLHPSVKEAQKLTTERVGYTPIEATPNELGGDTASQDSHNLGCTIDVRSPAIDKKIEKNLKLARSSVGLTTKDLKSVSIQSKKLVGAAIHHDDCYGTLTTNVLENMTDDEVIACTGRSRKEVLMGSNYNPGKFQKEAAGLSQDRLGEMDAVDKTGWSSSDSLRVVIGEAASELLGKELANETQHDENANGNGVVKVLKEDVKVPMVVSKELNGGGGGDSLDVSKQMGFT